MFLLGAVLFKNENINHIKNTIKMKTKNLSESLGYINAINHVMQIIKAEMLATGNPMVDGSIISNKILVGESDLSFEKDDGEYYTTDMIDSKNPTKNIAGEDALLLNPVYELNKK